MKLRHDGGNITVWNAIRKDGMDRYSVLCLKYLNWEVDFGSIFSNMPFQKNLIFRQWKLS